MKLAFKSKWSFGYREKDVPILINMGTLEAVCNMIGVEFYSLTDSMKDKSTDFFIALLYQGYITACKESYKRPKYKFLHAVVWFEYISQKSQKELVDMVQNFVGKYQVTDKKKVTANQ